MEIIKKSETKKCLTCGYERGLSESTPEYECPKCGRIYAKVEKALNSGSANRTSQALKQSVSDLQKKKEIRWSSVLNSAFRYLAVFMFAVFVIVFASLTVPGFMHYQCRSKQNEAKYNLEAIAKNEMAYRIKFNRYSSELSAIGFVPLSQGRTRYEYYIEYASADKFKAVAKSEHLGIGSKKGKDIWTIDETLTLLNTVRGCG